MVRLDSADRANKLTHACVLALTAEFERLGDLAENNEIKAVVLAGNEQFFSAGADLNEIARLGAATAFAFSRDGQRLAHNIAHFPVPVMAAIEGYCMGGGMDMALACHLRIAGHNAIFGHRGAALGVMTGWGGTQRLPRTIGRARALQMFVLAEMVPADEALRIGLVNLLADDPVAAALALAGHSKESFDSRHFPLLRG